MTQSPCNKICTLNDSGVCIGCGRDRSEIASWSRLSDADRKRVAERARARLKSANKGAATAGGKLSGRA